MPQIESGSGRRLPDPLNLKITTYERRPNGNTAAVKQSTRTCGHGRETVRNVVELDGAAAYVCRECFAFLRAVEFKTIVQRQVAALFRNLWPLGSLRGALEAAR